MQHLFKALNLKGIILPLILGGIVVYFHISWFDFSRFIFSWDFLVHSKELLNEFKELNGEGYWTGYINFGSYNIQPYHNIFKIFWGILGNHNIGTIFTVFIPILIIQGTGSYLFLKNVLFFSKNEPKKQVSDVTYSPWLFIGALYFCLNTYFSYTSFSHLYILFSLSLVPLLLYLFHKLLFVPNAYNMVLFIVFYSLSATYELRMTLINTIIIIIFAVSYPNELLRLIKKMHLILLGVFVFLCINAFWIVGVLQPEFKESAGAIINRGVFGNNLTDITYGFLGFKPYWDVNGNSEDFILRKVPEYMYLLPIFLLLNFFFENKRKYALLSLVLILLGGFLLKQDAPPYSGSYTFLYDHLPGFKIFREGSKFTIITILGYTIGLTLFVYNIFNEKRIPIILKRLLFLFVATIILLPILQIEKNGYTYRGRESSIEYNKLNARILQDNEFYKILSLPYKSNLLDMTYKNPVIIGLMVYKMLLDGVQEKYGRDWSVDLLRKVAYHEDFKKILYITGTKFIIVPQDDQFNQELSFMKDYGNRTLHINILKNALSDFTYTKDTRIEYFENPRYLSFIFECTEQVTSIKQDVYNICKNTKFEKIGPTNFKTTLSNLSSIKHIGISQWESSGWNLDIQSDEINRLKNQSNNWYTKDKTLLPINTYTIEKDRVIEYIHTVFGESLKAEGYPKNLSDGKKDYKFYTENIDGSINIDIYIYYRPNIFYKYSLIFSSIAFVMTILYLLFYILYSNKATLNKGKIN